MSQEIEKMKGKHTRSQGMVDYMLDIEGLCPFPNVQLPPKFKMSKMDSFDGTGNPKNHLKQSVLAMKPLGLTKEQIILCFPRTLNGVPYNEAEAFTQQYSYNIQLDVSLRDLETTKQLSSESFSGFLMRWRGKTSKMPNRPCEKDQVRMVMKNILPTYGHQNAPIHLKTFVELYEVGIQAKNAINSQLIEKSDTKPQKKFRVGTSSNSGNNGEFIKPLDLGRYTPSTSAPNYNANEY
ncbi:hypothetical protein SO802_010063 [Lithocarpus litseifolius]|uniref:Uncharacterized protein n=1 Tax=Lithocarpus litseifolius TaxID=425828 RepID=A0AAW2DDV2_9ROSI